MMRVALATARAGTLALVLGATISACSSRFVEIASGGELDPNVRPALAPDGTVVAGEGQRLRLGNGSTSSNIDLAPLGVTVGRSSSPRQAVQIRAAGDIVLVGERTSAACRRARVAYHTTITGAAPAPYLETCLDEGPVNGVVGHDIALSPNGTVALSSIVSGAGAVYRGPVAGPLAVLRSGTGTFYNTGALDVNDSGRVMVHFEYTDAFIGMLMRGILAFDTVEQTQPTMDTAAEKLGIGTFTPLAMNAAGTVAFSSEHDFTMRYGETRYSFAAGVYLSTPTPWNTPKMLTLVADKSGPYCKFGNVDINAAGTVVFEAVLDGTTACTATDIFHRSMDGLFTGPDPRRHTVVVRELDGLGDHKYFDSVVLGQINDAGQVSFVTTYSEPLAPTTKVWRFDP